MEGMVVAKEAGQRRSPRKPGEETMIDRWTYVPPYTLVGLMLFVGFISFIFDSRAVVHPTNQDVVRQIIASKQSFAAAVPAGSESSPWWWAGGALLAPGAGGFFLLRIFRRKKKEEPSVSEFARMNEPKRAVILRKANLHAETVTLPSGLSLRPLNMASKALAISQQFQERRKSEQRKAAQRPASRAKPALPTSPNTPAPRLGRAESARTPQTSDIFGLVFGTNWDGQEAAEHQHRGFFRRPHKSKRENQQLPPMPVKEKIATGPLGIA